MFCISGNFSCPLPGPYHRIQFQKHHESYGRVESCLLIRGKRVLRAIESTAIGAFTVSYVPQSMEITQSVLSRGTDTEINRVTDATLTFRVEKYECPVEYYDCCEGDVMDDGRCYSPTEPCDDCYSKTHRHTNFVQSDFNLIKCT